MSKPAPITIITTVLNQCATIAQCIESVLSQDVPGLEYIVIDGGSTDGTLDVIRGYESRLGFWLSEPDSGISHGMNKGLALARGELIGFVHADDILYPGALKRSVASLRRNPDAGFAFGGCDHLHADGDISTIMPDRQYAKRILRRMPYINHVSILARRRVFEVAGNFDARYRLAMDYDWLLRLHRSGFRGIPLMEIQGRMSMQGISSRVPMKTLWECFLISARAGYPLPAAVVNLGLLATKTIAGKLVRRLAGKKAAHRLRSKVNASLSSKHAHGSVREFRPERGPKDPASPAAGNGERGYQAPRLASPEVCSVDIA